MLSATELFKVNDHLLYLGTGVCRIDEIRTENFGGSGEKLYFVMRSVNDDRSVIFVPVDSEKLTSAMFPLMTEDEINDSIDRAEINEIEWIPDNKQRAADYKEIISRGDRTEILRIMRVLLLRKEEFAKLKRKFYSSDERVLAVATKVITDEFSFVLKIEPSEVIPYIKKRVGAA